MKYNVSTGVPEGDSGVAVGTGMFMYTVLVGLVEDTVEYNVLTGTIESGSEAASVGRVK